MPNDIAIHRVYRSINKPLTIWGVDRGLFFLALIMGGATFNFFNSLFGGVIMFAALFIFARWATATDPQILRVLLNSSKFRLRYDPGKCAPVDILDLGGSYESLTTLFADGYLPIGLGRQPFTINPFALPPMPANVQFLASFIRVLIESNHHPITERAGHPGAN